MTSGMGKISFIIPVVKFQRKRYVFSLARPLRESSTMLISRIFIGAAAIILYAIMGTSWAVETSVTQHHLTSDDQKIVDALVKMSGKDADTILRLYETGKGWGDVAENLGLEMEDVLKEVNQAEKPGKPAEK